VTTVNNLVTKTDYCKNNCGNCKKIGY